MSDRPPISIPVPPWEWRKRLRIIPQAFLRLSCFLLQPFQDRIPRRMLPIPPTPALLDEFLIEVHSIRQQPTVERCVQTLRLVYVCGGRFPHGAAISPDQSSDWRSIQCISLLVRLGIAIASHNSDISRIHHQPRRLSWNHSLSLAS